MATKETSTDAYAGLRTRAHWKREDATRVLQDWADSGESMAAFARRHRLGLHRLQWWRGQLKQAGSAEPLAQRLVPAVVRGAALVTVEPSATRGVVSVVTECGRVEIFDPKATDPRWVATLVTSLQAGPR
jgi:transposase-like protein